MGRDVSFRAQPVMHARVRWWARPLIRLALVLRLRRLAIWLVVRCTKIYWS